jgi:acetyl coenzyme A synthetase (ADP forming)-like protein
MASVRPLYLPAPYQDSAESGRVILRDGTTATIRPARSGDRDALRAFFEHLSVDARYRRFFALSRPAGELIDCLCDSSNPRTRLSLVVTRVSEGEPRIIATGSYHAVGDRKAEVAFAVDDAFQGRGLGSLLLERLAVLAAHNGIVQFWAVTQADNRLMIDVFRDSGFQSRERLEGGYLEVELSVVPNETSVAQSEMRDRVATTASLRPFFRPKSVAVIGASRDASSIGHRVLQALLRDRFQGSVYPVNPKADEVAGLRCYRSARELPEPIDLAVIAAPRDAVLGVVDDCAERSAKALVVITAGFAEVGPEGQDLQRRLLEKVRGYGMRMVGPNCFGLINADPEIRLNASFSPVFPPSGKVAMSSQSGALGLAVLAATRRFDLGLSTFVSVGNKADVSGNDLLQYWEEDGATGVILLYLESFGNPRRFSRIARRVSRHKPIVAVKAGRTLAGFRAAGSHTAALAASDVAVDALFRQTGVIRAETLEEMFELAAALDNQPLTAGRRVGVLTNAGGPAILCTDACEAGGLRVPELSAKTRAALAEFLPPTAGLGNPVDMIASATAEQYCRAVEILLTSAEVDALIVVYIPVGLVEGKSVTDAVLEGVARGRAAGAAGKPVLTCSLAEQSVGTQRPPHPTLSPIGWGRGQVVGEKIPCYAFPEAAARALSKTAAYAEWRTRPPGVLLDFEDMDLPRAKELCKTAVAQRGAGWLTGEETHGLLEAVHLPLPPGGIAKTASQASELAAQVGFPVAVKLASHRLVHKTEIGGIRLNVTSAAAAARAYEDICETLAKNNQLDAFEGVLIQPMIAGGVEVMIGVAEDRQFGPVIAFGLGGIHVEILGDVCFRITPLTDRDAREMVESIRGYRLLKGYRGHASADIAALEEVLLRVSRLVEEVPEISELDLNPIFALPPGQGCRIVDARIGVKAG